MATDMIVVLSVMFLVSSLCRLLSCWLLSCWLLSCWLLSTDLCSDVSRCLSLVHGSGQQAVADMGATGAHCGVEWHNAPTACQAVSGGVEWHNARIACVQPTLACLHVATTVQSSDMGATGAEHFGTTS